MTTSVLIVEDEERVLRLQARLLEGNGYACTSAASTGQAREYLKRQRFDLAVIDVNLPGESGLSLARAIASEHPNTATLMVTGVDDVEVARHALEAGSYGYLVKPFEPNDLLIQVATVLHRREQEMKSRAHQGGLESALQERMTSLEEIVSFLGDSQSDVEEMVLRLALAGEYRDDDTGRHVHRMSRYCAVVAEADGWNGERRKEIRLASMLHDIGKIALPDHILHKPGPLSIQETGTMRQHAEIGYRILMGSQAPLLQSAATIAWTHHEKYDGNGYPRGLAGQAIPVEGRIAAIADVFDALTSHRVYRPAYAYDQALGIMREESGRSFDPQLLSLFLDAPDKVLAIKEQYADR